VSSVREGGIDTFACRELMLINTPKVILISSAVSIEILDHSILWTNTYNNGKALWTLLLVQHTKYLPFEKP
jgi:hypothetical protein